MKLKFLLLVVLIAIFNCTNAQEKLNVKVDQRMEALSIFYILATVDTMDVKPTPSKYYKDFETYFEPFKNRKSLNWYRDLESWDGYDISSLGLFLSKNYPFAIKIEPQAKYVRSSSNEDFLHHFNEFYKDCNVEKFIYDHEKLYKSVCEKTKDSIEQSGTLQEIQIFYGKPTNGEFAIYLDLLNNMGNNAIPSSNVKFNGKRMFRLAYLNDESKNLTDESPVVFTPYLNVVTHEISHLFVQDFVKIYKRELLEISNLFLTMGNGEKLDQSELENEVDELLVRVCTSKILEQKFGKEKGLEEIDNQAHHYKLAKPLYNFFTNYTSNRNKYKSITDFYPEIFKFLIRFKE